MSGDRGQGLATEFDSADDSPGLQLWRVSNLWQSVMRATLKPFDLTHVQFVLLASLAYLDSTRPPTQAQLAEHARTDPMMTSQVLRALESKGLLVRQAHPDDKRAKLLRVTSAGGELASRAVVAVEAADAEFFGRHGPGSPFATALRDLANRPN